MSQRRYQSVSITFLLDHKVRGWDDDAEKLATYLMLNPYRATEGYYALSPGQMTDLIGWDRARLQRAVHTLTEDGFVRWDQEAGVVLILKALKYHPPTGAKTIAGAVNRLDTFDGTPDLFELFLSAAEKYAPEFGMALRSKYGMGHTGQSLSRDALSKSRVETAMPEWAEGQ